MSVSLKALLALLSTVILWSFLVVVARAIVVDVHPMTLLFCRLLVAATAFVPFLVLRKPWRHKAFYKLVGVSLLSTVNLSFFMWGIQFTTASASQLIYAAMPVLIIIISSLILKERYPMRKIFGVFLGLLGIIFIIYLSVIEKGVTIAGSLIGNLAMMVAMLGWMFYILFSKKLSKIFSPVEIGSVSIMVSFFISIPLFIWEVVGLRLSINLSTGMILAAIYMGFFGTFLSYILYQYAIMHASSLTVSLSSYVQPIVTAILAIIFLGEKLTVQFVFGSLLVFLGIFFTTTLELYHRRK